VAQRDNSNSVYFIGIDGGGTHCRARLSAVDGTVLAEATGGSANTTRGTEQTMQEVLNTCEQAVLNAGLTTAIYKQTFVGAGLAGLTITDEKLQYVSQNHPFAGMVSESDAYAACLGAHDGADGGIVIAGTGSAAFARANGIRHSIGGWGLLLGDDGSGARLGLNLLRKSIQVHDGMLPPSDMAAAALNQFDNDIHQLFVWARAATPKEFGTFAPMAFDWAEKGDVLAKNLVAHTVDAITDHIRAITKLGVARICLFGGMSRRLQPMLDENIRSVIVEPLGDAQDGGLLMARATYEEKVGAD
jgi:glucosamine kinase